MSKIFKYQSIIYKNKINLSNILNFFTQISLLLFLHERNRSCEEYEGIKDNDRLSGVLLSDLVCETIRESFRAIAYFSVEGAYCVNI
jgi:hypothetical protein